MIQEVETLNNTRPVVLVTGASRGIGRGIAEACAGAGHSVVINYVANADAASEAVQNCESLRVYPEQKFIAVQADVSLAEDRDRLLHETLQNFGRLDALVNNAGIAPRLRLDITLTDEASFRHVMDTNLIAPFFLSQIVSRHWLEGAYSAHLPAGFTVVFISSVSAEMASLNRGEYCIAKAGLSMASQLWALRLAHHGIQVYEVRPGIIETDMTSGAKEKYDTYIAEGGIPQMRWGTTKDVGRAVSALLEGSFPYSTGSIVRVDGGIHLQKL